MGRVSDILRAKGSRIFSIGSDATVYEAVKEMVAQNVGSLLVLDADGVKGIITERDYLREIVLQGRTSKTTKVREIMTSEIVVIESNRPIEECMAIMSERRIRHVPVIDDGALVGLVSIGDLVKQIANDREVEIRYLTEYITGRHLT